MINPCRSCPGLTQDKNSDECMRCARRTEYVAALEGRSCSVPVEMSDMGKGPSFKPDEDATIRENYPARSDAEIGELIGRSPGSVEMRRHRLGLIKQRQRQSKLKKPAAATAAKPPVEEAIPSEHLSRPNNIIKPAELVPTSDFVMVGLKGHEDLYERLCERAKQEFRTPELQALYFIHKGLASGIEK